jgi:TorA maturation chaperone TorD
MIYLSRINTLWRRPMPTNNQWKTKKDDEGVTHCVLVGTNVTMYEHDEDWQDIFIGDKHVASIVGDRAKAKKTLTKLYLAMIGMAVH